MDTTINVAISAEVALRNKMNNISNNLANMNTTGYKSQELLFSEYLVKNKTEHRPLNKPTSYVNDYGKMQNMNIGDIKLTGNDLDVALKTPDHFFEIQYGNNQVAYTRNGSFTINKNNQLTTQQGRVVNGVDNKPISIDRNAGPVAISQKGDVLQGPNTLGKLKVVSVNKSQFLNRMGDSLYMLPTGNKSVAATPVTTAIVRQGYLEGSNVSAIQATTDMIDVSRNFTYLTNLTQKEDQRISGALRTMMNYNG